MAKGQLFSTDLAISFSVVIIVLVITSLLWSYTVERKAVYHETTELRQIARDVSNTLILTSGTPATWTTVNDADMIGLAIEPHILDDQKVAALARSSQNATLQALGIIGPGYGLNMTVAIWNGSAFTPRYALGSENPNATIVTIHHRYALLNKTWAHLTLKVWR